MRGMGEYDFSELSDSRMTYLRNPPKFTYILVIAVIVILISTVVWSATAVKAEEIRTSGIVTTSGTIKIVAEISGTVTEVSVSEGDAVSENDIVLKLDDVQIRAELSGYTAAKENNEKRIEFIDRMISELNKDTPVQPFDKTEEGEFYNAFEYFLLQYNGASAPEEKRAVKMQTLSSSYAERNTCQTRIDTVASNIGACETSLKKCNIRALCSGTVHFDSDITKGTVMSSGTVIGSVSPDDSEKYILAYIPAHDRARIEVGQDCRFTVDGLLQNEYGSVKGTVRSISSDGIVSENAVMFKVTVSFEDSSVKDSKGNEVKIVNGMTSTVWTVYEKSTYLKYFLDKLGIKT